MPLKNLDLKLKDLNWGKSQEKTMKMMRENYINLAENSVMKEKIMPYSMMNESIRSYDEKYYRPKQENYNYMFRAKNTFLPHVKIFKEIKQEEVILIDQKKWVIEWTKKKIFQPIRNVEWVIGPTFHKIFYTEIKEKGENLTKMSLNNSSELQLLLTNAKSQISQNFTWFINQEIAQTLCQTANYNKKALLVKKAADWKQLEKIVNEIALWPTQLLYLSKNWNVNSSLCESSELLLIIDLLLYQHIKNTNYKNPLYERPQPLLEKLETEFPTIIHFPLKNSFQFIILDENALIVWYKTSQTEIKYDENKPLTYLVDYMMGELNN